MQKGLVSTLFALGKYIPYIQNSWKKPWCAHNGVLQNCKKRKSKNEDNFLTWYRVVFPFPLDIAVLCNFLSLLIFHFNHFLFNSFYLLLYLIFILLVVFSLSYMLLSVFSWNHLIFFISSYCLSFSFFNFKSLFTSQVLFEGIQLSLGCFTTVFFCFHHTLEVKADFPIWRYFHPDRRVSISETQSSFCRSVFFCLVISGFVFSYKNS